MKFDIDGLAFFTLELLLFTGGLITGYLMGVKLP